MAAVLPHSSVRTVSAVLCCCIVIFSHSCSAERIEDTENKVYEGYKFSEDITNYRNVSIDAKEIHALVEKGKWDEARQIHDNGKHVLLYRSIGSLGKWDHSGEFFYDTYKRYYNRIRIVTDYVGPIRAGADVTKIKVGTIWAQLMYLGNQLDFGVMFAGQKNKTAARHEVDDSFGLYYGYPENPSLWNFFAKEGVWFKCLPKLTLNKRAVALFNELNKAARRVNVVAYNKHYATLRNLLVVGWLRGVVYASNQVTSTNVWKTYASGWLETIRPLLKDQVTTLALVKEVNSAGFPRNRNKIKSLVGRIAVAQGISKADVGLC